MADVYRIGINILLQGTIQQQLATLSTQLLGLHTTAGQVTNQFNRWAVAIGGVAAVMGGSMLLGGIVKLAEHGKEVAHQLELMNTRGMDFAEIQEANAKALEVTGKVLTTTYSENLKHIQELRYAFGSTEEAMKYLEVVSKANAILNSVRGKFGGKDEIWELVKSGEILGKTANPEEEAKFIDFVTRAVTATGGKVTPASIMSSILYGRTAALGWSDEFMGLFLPRLIQSMGGGGGGGQRGPGNALMTAFAKIIGGQVSVASANEFQALGLGVKTHIKGAGSALLSNVAGRQLFLENPYEWIQQYAMPALAARGITDTLGITSHLQVLMGVRTAAGVLSEMALQGRYRLGEQSPFEKDKRLTELAMGVDAFDWLITRDPTTAIAAFHAQLKNLGEALGAPIWQPGGTVMTAIGAITMAINTMAKFAGANPEGVTLALEALAVIGSALVFSGIVALMAAIGGFVGAAGGIAAAAGALAALAALNWKNIQEPIEKLVALLTSFSGRGLPPGAAGTRTPATPWDQIPWIPGDLFKGRGLPPGAAGGGGAAAPFSERFGTWPSPSPEGGEGPSHAPRFKKQSYNAVPPPSGGSEGDSGGSVYLDGKKVGDIILDYIGRGASRPIEGSAYLDGTRPSYTSDMSLSYG